MTAVRKHVTAAKSMTVQSLARQMLDEAKGDINKAAVKLDNYASNIKRFNDEFRMLGVRTTLNALAGTQRAIVRAEIVKTPFKMNDAAKATQARIRRAGDVIKSALMEMEFQIGGVVKRLRDWTGTEIAAHGETQLMSARSSVRNAQFLIAVGRAAGKKTIGELGDAAVERMHKEAMESGE